MRLVVVRVLLGLVLAVFFNSVWALGHEDSSYEECPFPISAKDIIKEEARIVIDILEKYQQKEQQCRMECSERERVCVSDTQQSSESVSHTSSDSFAFQNEERDSAASSQYDSYSDGASEDMVGSLIRQENSTPGNSIGAIIGVATAVGAVFALLAILAFTLMAIYVYLKNRRKSSYNVFKLNSHNNQQMQSAMNEFLDYGSDSDDEDESTAYTYTDAITDSEPPTIEHTESDM